MNSALSIHIGITGHRDIPEQDSFKIKEALVKKFKAFKDDYPNTQIKVLSGVAEGADTIAAIAALEAGLSLMTHYSASQTVTKKAVMRV